MGAANPKVRQKLTTETVYKFYYDNLPVPPLMSVPVLIVLGNNPISLPIYVVGWKTCIQQ